MSLTRRLMMAASAVALPSLQLAVLLDTGISTTTATQVTLNANVAVSTGDYLMAWFGSRHGTSKAHISLVSSGFNCTFTAPIDDEQADTATSGNTRMSGWTGIVSAGGIGNIVGTTSANTFQRGLILLRIPGGASVAQTAIDGSEIGTGNSVAWSATPNATGLSVGCGIYQGNPSPSLAGHAAISGAVVDTNTNFLMRAWHKLLSPPNPLVFSGALTDRGRVVGALNIIEA